MNEPTNELARAGETLVTPSVAHGLNPNLPSVAETQLMVESMAQSGMFKGIADLKKAITVALVGRELGVPPATAIMGIHIVEGKPSISANLMASMLKKSGKYNYRVHERSDTACRIEFHELWGHAWTSLGEITYTMEMARRAGLTGKQNWKAYPEAMLFARAMSAGVRTFCPDLFGGSPVYYEGEIEESMSAGRETPAAKPPAGASGKASAQSQREFWAALVDAGLVKPTKDNKDAYCAAFGAVLGRTVTAPKDLTETDMESVVDSVMMGAHPDAWGALWDGEAMTDPFAENDPPNEPAEIIESEIVDSEMGA